MIAEVVAVDDADFDAVVGAVVDVVDVADDDDVVVVG